MPYLQGNHQAASNKAGPMKERKSLAAASKVIESRGVLPVEMGHNEAFLKLFSYISLISKLACLRLSLLSEKVSKK